MWPRQLLAPARRADAWRPPRPARSAASGGRKDRSALPDAAAPAAAPRTYYDELGVGAAATADEIKAAYLRLAKLHHPDVTGGSEATFRAINDAYTTLANGVLRRSYDWRTFGGCTTAHASYPSRVNAVDQDQRREFWQCRRTAEWTAETAFGHGSARGKEFEFRDVMEASIRRAQQVRWLARKRRAAEKMRGLATRLVDLAFWWVADDSTREAAPRRPPEKAPADGPVAGGAASPASGGVGSPAGAGAAHSFARKARAEPGSNSIVVSLLVWRLFQPFRPSGKGAVHWSGL